MDGNLSCQEEFNPPGGANIDVDDEKKIVSSDQVGATSMDDATIMLVNGTDAEASDAEASDMQKKIKDLLQANRADEKFLNTIVEQMSTLDPSIDKTFVQTEVDYLLANLSVTTHEQHAKNFVGAIIQELSKDSVPIVRETSPLASVQYVHSPKSIPNRDQIVTAKVQGFTVVVNKNQFFSAENKTLCIFFQPDSLLDTENEDFKFLESKKGRLVTTKKMYGVFSQGLCMPLDMVKTYGLDPNILKEGQDLTQDLKVTKHVSDEEKTQYVAVPNMTAPFPTQTVPKTDEPNLQSLADVLASIQDRHVTVTIKVDGSSMTVTDDGKLCGRNFEWTEKDNSNSGYFEMDEKYKIREQIKGTGLQFQGELCGPKIQNNPLGLNEKKWLVFNVFDSNTNQYLAHTKVVELCDKFGFDTVPCLYDDVLVSDLPFKSVQDWLEFANKQVYATNKKTAEGIVVKTVDKHSRVSFKVISQVYLTKK